VRSARGQWNADAVMRNAFVPRLWPAYLNRYINMRVEHSAKTKKPPEWRNTVSVPARMLAVE
jgi:hypothetical protein